ncbi:MAG TPA: hypothetical protein PKI15_08195, partial [Candidatus Cloacimonadota bacterium]|nr:hypothetical protein [Candidatus Cloacimonadota bacterium]
LYWFLNSLVALRHRVTPDADEIFIVFENQNISITGEDEHVIVQSTNGAFEITWGISYSDGGENPTPHISVSEYTIPDGPKGRS